ncbi:hypothetical protein [Brevibacillus massiliensis]|nr:hypothetical protein [Brevibacillus massiliensis]
MPISLRPDDWKRIARLGLADNVMLKPRTAPQICDIDDLRNGSG